MIWFCARIIPNKTLAFASDPVALSYVCDRVSCETIICHWFSVPRQMSLAYNELNGITKSRKSFGLELIQLGNVHYLWAWGGADILRGAIYFWQVGDL